MITLRHKIIPYENLFRNNYFSTKRFHAQSREKVVLSRRFCGGKVPQRFRSNSQGVISVIISCQRERQNFDRLPFWAPPFDLSPREALLQCSYMLFKVVFCKATCHRVLQGGGTQGSSFTSFSQHSSKMNMAFPTTTLFMVQDQGSCIIIYKCSTVGFLIIIG